MQENYREILEKLIGGNTTRTFNTGDIEEHRAELLLPILPIDHASDTVSQVWHAEVDQQSDSHPAESHGGEKLSLVDGMDCFHTL